MRYVLPAVLFWLTGTWVHADSIARPSSYREKSPDEKLVFVMIPPETTLEDELERYNDGPGRARKDEIRSIRTKYTKSGLYRNDGSVEPLWTVDAGWYRSSVFVPSDGIHLIASGGWATRANQRVPVVTKDDLKQVAFSIYARGKLVHEVTIADFVDRPEHLQCSVSHFFWCEESRLNDKNGHLVVTTLDDNYVVFDFKSGKVLSKVRIPVTKGPQPREFVLVEPTAKWFGANRDAGAEAKCPETPIVTQADFEKLWKLLRGAEKTPNIDFSKEFVLVRTTTSGTLTKIEFYAAGRKYAYSTQFVTSVSGEETQGFTYAIVVLSREKIDPVEANIDNKGYSHSLLFPPDR
jgi:hypothetical protein